MDSLPKIGRPNPASSEAPQRHKDVAEASSQGYELSGPSRDRQEGLGSPQRRPVRPYVRTLARIPFEIYKDQHEALKAFSLEEQTMGERGSMSQMVREALDSYIKRRRDAD